MQTLRKKSSPNKYRNDRFFGDGVTFRAKLFGCVEVGEARGDRMCQEALQDLKMAIRAAGEHKQRIIIHVSIEGLRLREEKTGDCLYHHPVHKISFIAQDMTDSRAFGYIFGSPDSGHRFFGIKTDKAASQVVLAMRDLFQVVFELKKKEIELARQNIQSKSILGSSSHHHQNHPLQQLHADTNASTSTAIPLTVKSSSGFGGSTKSGFVSETSLGGGAYGDGSSAGDLVDLEKELNSLQRGITQMERITPNEFPSKQIDSEDPFGDSFTNFTQYNIPPPPETTKSRHSKPLKPPVDRSISDSSPPLLPPEKSPKPQNISPPITERNASPNVSWINDTLFDEDSTQVSRTVPESSRLTPQKVEFCETEPNTNNLNASNESGTSSSSGTKYVDAFSDLDPLGTGKIKPYVDKKYFFQELKNPPKLLLKDLSNSDVNFSANFSPTMRSEDVYIDRKDSDEGSQSGKNFDDPFFNLMSDPFTEEQKHEAEEILDQGKKEDLFEFSFSDNIPKERKDSDDRSEEQKSDNMYRGALKVNLPPESSSYSNQKRVERQSSDASNYNTLGSSIRNRPSSVFKQNTVDVISSISSKKMMKPHLFGQKFSKRDSNSINMRRLQESDSLSENEAPEPPPRPDAGFYTEPPPLPPKKQFSDIIIRPTVRSGLSKDMPRYESAGSIKSRGGNQDAPPLPLPSRRITRTESHFPGPERPFKEPPEDDYLTPYPQKQDLPILLPPPQTDRNTKRGGRKSQGATNDLTKSPKESLEEDSAISDITLSQLLTLSIDDLADKLNVPSQKLSTMTIVELTKYLSEFLRENSSKKKKVEDPPPTQEPVKENLQSAVFKVSFDDSSDATFVAVFDDNFGEETTSNEHSFVADFDSLNIKPEPPVMTNNNVDKYAVFREIIENELNTSEEQTEEPEEEIARIQEELCVQEEEPKRISPIALIPDGLKVFETKPSTSPVPTVPMAKIDTKITEAISHAKDRYAALRDIILVEDLFEKPTMSSQNEASEISDAFDEMEKDEMPETSSLTEVSVEEKIQIEDQSLSDVEKGEGILSASIKDDVEIDELMNLAVSNLSLNNNQSLSPKPLESQLKNASTSPIMKSISPSPPDHVKQGVDTSTSPIPIHKTLSPVPMASLNQVHTSTSPRPPSVADRKSPQLQKLEESIKRELNSGSLSDMVGASSSPDLDNQNAQQSDAKGNNTNGSSWAVFVDTPAKTVDKSKEAKPHSGGVDSPCSSDGKDEMKLMDKKWPKGHTSSSSRDVSPWDDDGQEYRRRPSPGITSDRQGHYMRHGRRMNSCDEDYEYENDYKRSREQHRRQQTNWYHAQSEHTKWSSPPDFEEELDRRSFDRSAYERSTYGPPYDKRDQMMKSYRNYEKRKFYASYGHKNYADFDDFGDHKDAQEAAFDTSPSSFNRSGSRDRSKMNRDYFHQRDRKSFDRESNESYESGSGGGGSRKITKRGSREGCYGSMDLMRDDYPMDGRSRYASTEKGLRGSRKGLSGSTSGMSSKSRRSNMDAYDDDLATYDPEDSDLDANRHYHSQSYGRSYVGEGTRSLQRPHHSGSRVRKSSGSSPWDGEGDEGGHGGKQSAWGRPASASEAASIDRRRFFSSQILTGSDNEKDRRLRMKSRGSSSSSTAQLTTPRSAASRNRNENEFYFEEPLPTSQMGGSASNDRLSAEGQVDSNFFSPMSAKSPRSFDDRQGSGKRKGQSAAQSIRKSGRSDGHYAEVEDRRFKNSHSPIVTRKSNLRSSRKEPRRSAMKGGNVSNYDDEGEMEDDKNCLEGGDRYSYEDHEDHYHKDPRFNYDFEEQGFESDFIVNSPKQQQKGQKSFRFSNDFSGSNFETDFERSPMQQKLRFNDKIKVSRFKTNFGEDESGLEEQIESRDMFEDDFSKVDLTQDELEAMDQWNEELPARKPGKPNASHSTEEGSADNIRKSESVNIFAKKYEDPFEDDDFFKSTNENKNGDPPKAADPSDPFAWDNNFAKFDDNDI